MRTEFYILTADWFFSHPLDRSRQFGEIHVRRHRRHGNELLLPEAATLSAGACRTISGAPTLRAMFAKMKAHTHARAQKAPAAPARGEITLSRGERSPPCLFPSRKLKSGILGGGQDAKKQEEEAHHEDNSAVESNQHVCLNNQRKT